MATEVLTFSDTATDDATTRQKRRVSQDGRLSSLHISFPPTTNNALDVRVNLLRSATKATQIVPAEKDAFIRWDSAVLRLRDLDIEVKGGEDIEVEWQNSSGGDLNCPVVAVLTS
jgi:hypothetical protein